MSKRPGSPMLIKNSSSLQAIEMSVQNEMNPSRSSCRSSSSSFKVKNDMRLTFWRGSSHVSPVLRLSLRRYLKNFDASVRKLVQLHGHEENSALKLELECSALGGSHTHGSIGSSRPRGCLVRRNGELRD